MTCQSRETSCSLYSDSFVSNMKTTWVSHTKAYTWSYNKDHPKTKSSKKNRGRFSCEIKRKPLKDFLVKFNNWKNRN